LLRPGFGNVSGLAFFVFLDKSIDWLVFLTPARFAAKLSMEKEAIAGMTNALPNTSFLRSVRLDSSTLSSTRGSTSSPNGFFKQSLPQSKVLELTVSNAEAA
jgi:hypothetical protein